MAWCTLSQVAEKRVKVLVSGQVQGVFFRVECARRARDLGVGGHAQNLSDGRVEAVFEGDAHSVDQMITWCREGPPLAQVVTVQIEEESPRGERDFRITH
jgi:acylphosphatase